MERVSRLIVIGSIALAGVTHAWLVNWHSALAPAAVVAFVAGFFLGRASLAVALFPILATAYAAPALLAAAFGSSDLHLMLVWLAALGGTLAAHLDSRHWSLPAGWRLPIAAWALTMAVSWPIVASREVDFSFVAARTLDTTNALFEGPPAAAAAFVTLMALAQMLGILWVDLLWAKFSGPALAAFPRVVVWPLVGGVGVGSVVGIYQTLVDQSFMNAPIWSNLQRAGGLSLDANSFGIGAALWAPIAVVTWWSSSTRWLGLVLYALLAAGMWTAGSRTALVAFVIGSGALAVAALKSRRWWHARVARLVTVCGALLLVLVVAFAPRDFESANPLQRAFARIPRFERSEIVRFADELWSRFGYGRAAVQMIADHPLSGVGIGAFHIVAPDYMFRDSGVRVAADNAQNWWRHQLAELGIIGAFAPMWFSGLLLATVWRGRPAPEDRFPATVIGAVLVGVGVASLLGVPAQNPATWISFVTLAFWLGSLSPLGVRNVGVGAGRTVWALTLIPALVVGIGTAISARGELRVAHRAQRSNVPYGYGLSATQGFSELGELRWAKQRSVMVIAVPHRWLQLTMWAPHQDVAADPVEVRLTLNGREVLDRRFDSSAPVVYFLEMTPDARPALVELSVSREAAPGLALQVATVWKRELPTDTPAEQILQVQSSNFELPSL